MGSRASRLAGACREHGVALVYLFGSRQESGVSLLKDESVTLSDPLADVDVGVVMLGPLPGSDERYRLYARLYDALTDVFPGVPLDLVLLQETHSVFQAQAVAGQCVYAASEECREAYEDRVLARAADFRPFLELFYRERLGEVGQ